MKTLWKCKRKLKRASPTILTFVGAAGVVITAISTAKATPKAIALIEQEEYKNKEKLSNFEKIKIAGPCYITPFIFGSTTILCIFGANMLNKRQQASITSAYALLNQSYKKYRTAANEVFGEDADRKIKVQMAKDVYIYENCFGTSLYDSKSMPQDEKILFYDSITEQYFNSTMAAVINAQYHINRNLTLRGYVTVNEYLEFLGLDKKDSEMDYLGWDFDNMCISGLTWLDFDNQYTKLDDGIECYTIFCIIDPALIPMLVD